MEFLRSRAFSPFSQTDLDANDEFEFDQECKGIVVINDGADDLNVTIGSATSAFVVAANERLDITTDLFTTVSFSGTAMEFRAWGLY